MTDDEMTVRSHRTLVTGIAAVADALTAAGEPLATADGDEAWELMAKAVRRYCRLAPVGPFDSEVLITVVRDVFGDPDAVHNGDLAFTRKIAEDEDEARYLAACMTLAKYLDEDTTAALNERDMSNDEIIAFAATVRRDAARKRCLTSHAR